MIGFDIINNWDTALKEMNKDRVGLGTISLSLYFPSFTVCAKVYFHLPCGQTKEGIAQEDLLKENYHMSQILQQ